METNRFKIYKDLALLVLLAAAVFGGIYWYVSTVRDQPEQTETNTLFAGKIERRLKQSIKESQEFVEDDSLKGVMDTIKHRLLQEQSALHPDSVDIYVIEESSINAFATIGNNIFITRGLTGFAGSPETLAAVVAHEIAHLSLGHPQSRLKMKLGGSVISSILTGGNSSMILELSRTMMDLKFSRTQEQEADDEAVTMLLEAGVHPQNLSQFLLKLKARHSDKEPVSFLSTHPQSSRRIENIVETPVPDGFEPRPIEL